MNNMSPTEEFIKEKMVNPLTTADVKALEYTKCYSLDSFENHFICVIIGGEFVAVTHTYAKDFKAKRKLLKLMKELYFSFNKRVIVGKDSEHFNRYKRELTPEIDEIIIKEKLWVAVEDF